MTPDSEEQFNYIKDSEERGYPRPRVIGHRNLRKRFDRYKLLESHRAGTNRTQFQVDLRHPDVLVYADTEFEDRLEVTVGGEVFLIRYGNGHTDDALWVYCPGRKVLCSGDLFQWTAANVGNPYKAQRFAKENVEALEAMAAHGAEVLCPGHGPAIHGKAEIETCLLTAARYLRHIQDHVVACLNGGMLLEEILNSLKMPDDLMNSKWLPPIYGHPLFIARGIYHRYAGYYSGNPAELFPPDYAEKSKEVLDLAGGATEVIERAKEVHVAGNMRLACQLAEWVVKGDPSNREGWEVYGLLFKERAENEYNMQARGCWNSAVRKAITALEGLDGD